MEDKTIFMTGGAGFIGSTLIGRLIERNHIVVFDNLSRNALSKLPYGSHRNLKLVFGDVTDSSALRDEMVKADPHIVVHMAAIAGIDTVIKSPTTTMRVNLIGTLNALESARGQPQRTVLRQRHSRGADGLRRRCPFGCRTAGYSAQHAL